MVGMDEPPPKLYYVLREGRFVHSKKMNKKLIAAKTAAINNHVLTK